MKNRIVLAREHANLNQKELAEKMGISPSTLNGYEKGNHDPKSSGLIEIAKICNVTTDYLLGLSDDIEKNNLSENKSDSRLKLIIYNYNQMNDIGKDSLLEQSEFLLGKHTVENPESKIG